MASHIEMGLSSPVHLLSFNLQRSDNSQQANINAPTRSHALFPRTAQKVEEKLPEWPVDH
jgi:hypothetical protein